MSWGVSQQTHILVSKLTGTTGKNKRVDFPIQTRLPEILLYWKIDDDASHYKIKVLDAHNYVIRLVRVNVMHSCEKDPITEQQNEQTSLDFVSDARQIWTETDDIVILPYFCCKCQNSKKQLEIDRKLGICKHILYTLLNIQIKSGQLELMNIENALIS